MPTSPALLAPAGFTSIWNTSPACLAQRICQIHFAPLSPRDLAGGGPVFISVRDPIERAVSAFNYRHPTVRTETPKDGDSASRFSM